MDNSVPSYPTQEGMESTDGHEEAPEPSEMTWTLSQLVRKNRRTNRRASTPKKIVQDESVQEPASTPVQIPTEPTPGLNSANADEPHPIDTSTLSHSVSFIQTQLTINSTPLFRAPRNLHKHLAPHHSQAKIRHLKLTANSPPAEP
jgi:hypothetical protein